MSTGQETRYLYSKENTSLYHGFLEEHNRSKCMYSRNLVAIMDSQTNKMNSFYEDHIVTCKTCQEVAQSASMKNQRVRSLIPKIEVPEQLPLQIKSDLKEAITLFKDQYGESAPSLNGFSLFKMSMIELFQSRLVLRSLLQGLVIALFTFLLLWTVSA